MDDPRAATALVRAALGELGVKHLLFAIHDASFPSDPDEDIGRGAPGTRASARLVAFLARLGFTGIQLGPQGQTARDNPSPYDGTIFSRAIESIPLSTFTTGSFAGTVASTSLREATAGVAPDGRADPARAHATMHRLGDEAFTTVETSAPRGVAEALAAFRGANAPWLDRDALYAAISAENGGASFRHWDADRGLFARGADATTTTRAAELLVRHRRSIDRYAFGQLLAHQAHGDFRELAARLGLSLHADLQAGLSETDTWGWQSVLLHGYAMGAPPSRTTAAGQPWGYAVLDPDQLGEPSRPGPALRLLAQRFEKVLGEHDGVRIDHPHALVCPWVYPLGSGEPGDAVRHGARLFASPDLPDHPRLARYAIARPAQLDRSEPRHADAWVTTLEPEQIERYAVAMDLLVATARRHGRDSSAIACEVLSTMPFPLGCVLERSGLGRFRVIQKARLDDPADVYRPDNARSADWMMLGTHDTPSIWAVVRGLSAAEREQWASHLAGALHLTADARSSLASDPGLLAHAMLADLFACPAENVLIFFTDLFGYEERYNEPGTTSPDNWSLRLPASFERLYQERAAQRAALDLPLALAMALEARGDDGARRDLARALRALSASR